MSKSASSCASTGSACPWTRPLQKQKRLYPLIGRNITSPIPRPKQITTLLCPRHKLVIDHQPAMRIKMNNVIKTRSPLQMRTQRLKRSGPSATPHSPAAAPAQSHQSKAAKWFDSPHLFLHQAAPSPPNKLITGEGCKFICIIPPLKTLARKTPHPPQTASAASGRAAPPNATPETPGDSPSISIRKLASPSRQASL